MGTSTRDLSLKGLSMGTKMVREDKTSWKAAYFTKLTTLLDEYPKCFIVGADNVGSKQMQEIRIALRGQAVVMMGKNTMMRKAIRGHLETNPDLERLLPHIKQNVGFVFTNKELLHVRDLLLANKVKAPAKAGANAPIDVVIPAQTLVWDQRRPASSRLWLSPPRLPRVLSRSSRMLTLSKLVTVWVCPRPLSSTC